MIPRRFAARHLHVECSNVRGIIGQITGLNKISNNLVPVGRGGSIGNFHVLATLMDAFQMGSKAYRAPTNELGYLVDTISKLVTAVFHAHFSLWARYNTA